MRFFYFTYITLLLLISDAMLFGQSLANYSSVRNTGASYSTINTTGNAFDSWRNVTGFTQDDNRSDFTDIGFDFWYNGVRYTQFSVSTNGFIDFSSSTDDGGPTADDFGFSNAAFTSNNLANSTNPAIAPFYDDLMAQGGTSALGNSIKYQLTGSAPNRTLTVEWINMAVYGNTSPSLNFQVKLVESTGVVLINYGTMNSGTQIFSYTTGMNAATINATPTAAQLKVLQTVNTNNFSNTIQNNLSAMPAANSQYIFTPPVPTASSGSLSFTGVSQTGMIVNWPNWATNEVGYVLYNSTDNVNFNFVNQTTANSTNYAASGLLPGTTYYWRVYAVTEGCLSSPLIGQQATSSAGNKVSITSGSWNTATTWSPTGVPTAADNVTINSNHTVTINTNAVCNNLTVGQTTITGAVLNIGNNNTARTVSVNGSITINSGAILQSNPASNTTHTISIPGNIINNGSLNFASDAGSLCDAIFTKNGNQIISGSGTTTTFNKITLNMGSNINNTLDVQTSSFVAPSDFLILNFGTFKLSTTGASVLTLYSIASTIPQKGGFWLNSSSSTVNVRAALTMYGNLTVSNGIFNVGDVANEDLVSNGGILSISNGTLNIAGKYYAVGINNLSKFNISGGSVIVPSIGSTNTTIAPFQIAGAGSQFNMSGGNLIIPREGGTGAQNLGFVNTGTSGGSVTGGTLQIGSITTPANQIIQINSSFPIGNLLVNSANANMTLLTSSLSVINNVTINSGTITANNLNISLGRNWQNNGGTFVPGNGTVLFNGTLSQTIFKSAGEIFNNITFSNAGAKSLLSAITASNVTINNGSNLDVSTSNFQITCRGNFINSGTFNARNGLIFLNGTTAQTIGGSSITNFYDLTLNNNSGASLTNAENLNNVLTLNNGTFNTNGQAFTMISNASNTARIAQITGTGDITGNVTVQRFAPGGYTGWALLGTPISSGLTFQDWDDDMPISCATCPDGSAGGFISIYSYNEAAAGSYSAAAGYVAMTSISDPITPNKGYWVYLGTGQTSTAPITIDATGTVRKFNNTIPLSKTNTGSAADDGWNLIHNPYPSPISWAALRNGNANVDNAIYTYNADLNGGTGASAAYVNGVSSPAVGAGGIGDIIPMCQGFYVHCSAATSLNAAESNKVAGNPTFLKLANNNAIASNIPLFRLTLGRANFKDETVVYLNSSATNNFDQEFDAIKMAGQDPYAPSIRQVAGNTELQINGIDLSSSNFSIPILATTGYNGTYTISLQDFSNFPQGACINLYDTQTGTTTNLRTNNYIFNLTSTTTTPRFTLNITLNPLQITSNVTQPQCTDINAGQIVAVGNNSGPWNYKWKDISGNTIKTSLNKITADTLNNIIGGDYTVDINTVGQCDQNTTTFNINTIEIPNAQFSSADTIDLTITSTVQFNNTSSNSQDFSWNFGDNIGTSFDPNPSYSYLASGTYSVLLIATSSSGCVDSVAKSVVVINNITTSLNTISADGNIILKTIDANNYQLQIGSEYENLNISVTDNLGRIVVDNSKIKQTDKGIFDINMSELRAGVYYINLYHNKNSKTFKVINQ